MPRSYIIGTGIISALGNNIADTEHNLFNDTTTLPQYTTRFKTELKLPVFEVHNINLQSDQPGGISAQLLLIALNEALANAKLTTDDLQNKKVGVAIGTTVACQLNNIEYHDCIRKNAVVDNTTPYKNYINGNPAELIRRTLKLKGPAITVSNACSSGADAIGIAHLWIQQGICDIAIAGGTDELSKVALDGFNALGVCSPEPCRPFDAARKGLNLGEAAGVVILSSQQETPFSIASFGKSSDAFHITQPAPDGNGLEAAIHQAMEAAHLTPEDIAFINAHGTGTQANDTTEAAVFARMFPNGIPYMSTKGKTGHTLGAAGAIEAIFTMLMLKKQCATASTRFETLPDNIANPPLTHNKPLTNAHYALSTSLAFGGSNTALIIHAL